MLKGVNRNVLVVRVDKDSRFESVYFVMKKGKNFEKGDVLKEANSIISKSKTEERGEGAWRYGLIGFFTGTVCGGILIALMGVICFLLE